MDIKACNFGFKVRHNIISSTKTHKNSNKQTNRSVPQAWFQHEVTDHRNKKSLTVSKTD